MKCEFLTTSAINIKDGCADKARISLEQPQGLAVLAERFEKARCLFSGESDYTHFCDHDRPAKDRADSESQENDLSRDGGMFKSEKEPTAREEFREQNRRQVELINNVFRKKRKCCAFEQRLSVRVPRGPSSRAERGTSQLVTHPRTFGRSFAVCAAQDDGAMFLGNVGRNFAITTNAIPIAIRKKEKNCPRVKAPTSGASGSRKFSQMMRK